MIHGYFLITITTPLTDEQKLLVRDALLSMGTQSDPQPARITHMRFSNDKQQAIVEVTVNSIPTKVQVVAKLAELLPWSEATISDNSTFTVFGTPAEDREDSRLATIQFLKDDSEEWEVVE